MGLPIVVFCCGVNNGVLLLPSPWTPPKISNPVIVTIVAAKLLYLGNSEKTLQTWLANLGYKFTPALQ